MQHPSPRRWSLSAAIGFLTVALSAGGLAVSSSAISAKRTNVKHPKANPHKKRHKGKRHKVKRPKGKHKAAPKEKACVPADNGRSGPGHFLNLTSVCENATSTLATFPLQRGSSNGRTVWYVVTESSNESYARAHGLNFAPKLANASGSAGVQTVSMQGGEIVFPASVTFGHKRVLVPGPNGFPPSQAEPPAVGEPGYSPLIKLPDGTILDAPHIANATGQADKVTRIDTVKRTVQYRETEGRYEDKHVHYASFDSSSALGATLEDVTLAPALASLPAPGDEGLGTSARERLVAFVNGPTGARNPQRQGLNSAILDKMDPINLLHETPVLDQHADVGDLAYSPIWDIHLAEWTAKAIAGGDRAELRSTDQVDREVSTGDVTGPGGKPFGPSGTIANCPVISMDIP